MPDKSVLRGTIRTYDPAVRDKILDGVARTAKAVADMAVSRSGDHSGRQGGGQ